MGKFLIFINYILEFLVFCNSILALIYFVSWGALVVDEQIFQILNNIFGLLPLMIDKIFYYEIDIMGKEVSMGYVFSALLFALIALFLNKLTNKFYKFRMKSNEKKSDYTNKTKENNDLIQKQKEDMMKARISYINTYFGLFEFNMEYFDSDCQNKLDLKKLKVEYSKLIANKLKEKYKNVNFVVFDKMFFLSDDFSSLNFLIEDIVNLYQVFSKITEKKFIKTDMLMSLWCDDRKNNPKEVLKILEKMNLLKYLNKIIVPYKFTERYKQEKQKFKFIPQGISWLDIQDENDSNMEIELFSVKKV